ncbi:beta-ketoacyl synthase chain length factor [Budvicia diplopodorum]|uniref:beta-ketoacyl synthase chain length factor n=1 Tax=Budvicia diplopodorum TaxID=1119056 RepID=UPI00135AF2C5|nr:beta-ketoacyl synthase chain length factor [Budvicia diplopodorum]
MTYSLNILGWHALAPGLSTSEQWVNWSAGETQELSGDLAKSQLIPMMTARRMSIPSRLAVEVGLTLLEQRPDAAVFISRHGELERTYKIIESLCLQQDISPTDFAMSVHNTAAGLLTISGKAALPLASLSAGIDGFQQGMLEVQAMLAGGAKKVLLVDFDGAVPQAYHSQTAHQNPPYAVGLLISAGVELRCQQINKSSPDTTVIEQNSLPQSLRFVRHWLNNDPQFTLQGMRSDWQWKQS